MDGQDGAGAARANGGGAEGPRPREKCAEACLDLLLIEMLRYYGGGSPAPSAAPPASQANPSTAGSASAPKPLKGGLGLEAMGFQVGSQLVERYARRRARFLDTLDVVKFLCKEFWTEVFKKQVDNLKTNHRGIFVLHDGHFRWLRLASAAKSMGDGAATMGADAAAADGTAGGGRGAVAVHAPPDRDAGSKHIAQLLRFPCGLIRGALFALGIDAVVTAEAAAQLPACSFTVKIAQGLSR